MKVKQLYTECLAEATYYIESGGEAAIVDPLRETEPYLRLAGMRNAKIKYIFETHFHADFVSGHLDLAKATGATIVYGPTANPAYPAYIAEDREVFKLGNVSIKVLYTPGHTMESVVYLLLDENGKEHAIFTGDTLFVGDVGRPDLAVERSKSTKEELAAYLYDSLHSVIMPLPDDVILYPGHGAGSQCGRNIGKETLSTLGEQKKFNYALQAPSKEAFVHLVTTDLPQPPAYFPENAKINQLGYENIDTVMKRNLNPLSPEEFEKEAAQGAAILDSREPLEFEKGFLPGSLNVGLSGQFGVWVGTLLHIKQPLILVTEPGKEEETILRLARVGFENVKGYLKGGVEAWREAGKNLEEAKSASPDLSVDKINSGYQILDVRTRAETSGEHYSGALNIPLRDLPDLIGYLDKNEKYVVYCASGYRSMIATSILKANGFDNLLHVHGGYEALRTAKGAELTAGKLPRLLEKTKVDFKP